MSGESVGRVGYEAVEDFVVLFDQRAFRAAALPDITPKPRSAKRSCVERFRHRVRLDADGRVPRSIMGKAPGRNDQPCGSSIEPLKAPPAPTRRWARCGSEPGDAAAARTRRDTSCFDEGR